MAGEAIAGTLLGLFGAVLAFFSRKKKTVKNSK
jgi:hypothetical protein